MGETFEIEDEESCGIGDVAVFVGEEKESTRVGRRPLRSRMRGIRNRGCDGLRGGEGGATERGGTGRIADGGKKGPTVGRRCDPP